MDAEGLEGDAAEHRLAFPAVGKCQIVHVLDLAGNGADAERFGNAGHSRFGDAGGALGDFAALDALFRARADKDHVSIRSRGGQHTLHPAVDGNGGHHQQDDCGAAADGLEQSGLGAEEIPHGVGEWEHGSNREGF